MISKSEIESVIYLLDDPDPEVQSGVEQRFRELGENAVPLLDQFKSESKSSNKKKVITEVIHSITFISLIDEFTEAVERGINNKASLEQAVLILARFGNPTLRTEEYKQKLDYFADQIGEEVSYTPSMKEKMQIVLQYVFRELRFRGDAKNYHSPENAFIDRVIERRKGLPIMLSLIVLFIAERLNLPFHGVNMPIHFMLMYKTHDRDYLIDPFDGGTIVTYDQCCYFLKKNGIEPKAWHLQKTDENEILARCIRNLMHSYAKQHFESKVKDLKELLQIVELKG
ncbi:MAG: transglutaminase family protein [Balneolaceae bacterium]